jgi:outer membrane protein
VEGRSLRQRERWGDERKARVAPPGSSSGGVPGVRVRSTWGRGTTRGATIASSIRWLAVLGVLLTPSAVRGQGEPTPAGEVLTLDQAIRLAVQNNRQVQIAALEVRKDEHEEAVQRTRRLPSLSTSVLATQLLSPVNFRFNQGAFGTFPGIGPVPGKDTDVRAPQKLTTFVEGRLSQPLTQLHRIRLGIRMQEAVTQAAREALRAQQQSVIAQVKQAYYGLLQTQSALEANEETLRFDRELERVVADEVVQQAALQSDLLQVKAQLARQEYETLTLRNSFAATQDQLNRLLGRDVRTEFRVSPVPETTAAEQDLATLQNLALKQRPELREAGLKLTQATYDRRITRSQYTPDISLALNYLQPYNIQVIPDKIFNVGILLTWEPWDWGRKREELAEKSQVIGQAKQSLQDTEAQVLIDVNTQFRKLREAQELLRVTQALQAAQREKTRVAMNQFTQKAALLKDVLQEQASLADANHQYKEALLQFATAQAGLEKALGQN